MCPCSVSELPDPRYATIAALRADLENARLEIDALRRALAAGPAALRARSADYVGSTIKAIYKEAAVVVEDAHRAMEKAPENDVGRGQEVVNRHLSED
jgi:hypothetical protein